MDVNTFENLMNGSGPSLEEYATFVAVIEKLPPNLLWRILTECEQMNKILKNVVAKVLQEKVPKENIDNSLEPIVEKLREKFTNS
jgi:hypothetical protein